MFNLGVLGEGLQDIQFDLDQLMQKDEQAKHKGVSSKAKENVA